MSDDDEDWDGRDLSGRWCKGHCPNPKGRPRKKAEVSDADMNVFKNTVQEITINGVRRQLTRHGVLLHSMYEQAVKGKSVNTAKKLLDRFEQAALDRAGGYLHLRDLNAAIDASFKRNGKHDDKLLAEAEELMNVLNYGEERAPERKPRVRKKTKASAPTWRTEPKPDWLVDEEERYAEQEHAKFMARARHTLKNIQNTKKVGGPPSLARPTKKTEKE
jgi:Family of unknown function (DUF5681)